MKAKEIKQLVEIVEKSSIHELEVTRWGRKVCIRKGPGNGYVKIQTQEPATRSGGLPVAIQPAELEKPVIKQSIPQALETVTPEKTVVQPVENKKIIFINAPMVGTFYRAPAPDAEPFVKEQDTISQGTVLCIIEAMKLMNEIEAETNGRILEILVENGQPVEYNQSLFRVEQF